MLFRSCQAPRNVALECHSSAQACRQAVSGAHTVVQAFPQYPLRSGFVVVIRKQMCEDKLLSSAFFRMVQIFGKFMKQMIRPECSRYKLGIQQP